jgi:hypothetical protein
LLPIELADRIREVISLFGPLTVDEVAILIDESETDIGTTWPHEIANMRLRRARYRENHWSNEDVLGAIQNAALYEFPLTIRTYAELLDVGQIQGPSVPRICQRFGTWSAACDAAGVVAHPARRANYQSKWTDDDLLSVVRRYVGDHAWSGTFASFDQWRKVNVPEGPSSSTLRTRFGTWTEIKRRALKVDQAHG